MIKLYGHELSGNVYKIRLLLALLEIEYEFVPIDVFKGEHKTPEYLKLNPFGQIPVLIDGDKVFPDAQAILVYLARQYGTEQWLPTEAESLSRVIRWLSTTAGEIRQGVESARLFHFFKVRTIDIDAATQKSAFILDLINRHLADREWLELEHPTIADIAAFPYIALAPDGQVSLEEYPYIVAWIERIKRLPGFVGMPGIEAVTTA
ncbi:Protein GstA [Hyella patelloides LEGE 07179]|uniref:Protein GstA n=1 Tax=Hyella patelloides LEGE 07179 TaxID=945734 RepID=A0A563VLN2_9CYAN|nr:glutathione S-transferase family protein [Hyella patelloides]VEP12331.1 Protein GstA [Hyella patelloides LEGE 07179]